MEFEKNQARFLEVPATYRRFQGVWLLRVKCPFCAGEHRHGGGTGERPYFGHRVSDCRNAAMVRTYLLVNGGEEPAKPKRKRRARSVWMEA